MINYDGPYGPNTIVINTDERRLYYVYANGKAIKYGVGVGREGFQWSGTDTISRKAEWPGWTPPPEMIAREKAKGRILPRHMAGRTQQPARRAGALYRRRMYRIHGSNEPWTIGQRFPRAASGMTNDDVIDLYDRVRVGTRVVVLLSTRPQTEARLPRPGRKTNRCNPEDAAPGQGDGHKSSIRARPRISPFWSPTSRQNRRSR